ncbi:MAG TPA: amidohydrolase family protein [Gemmatimonadales bacterium]|nr:amidohydrolase family protein [Gemmatimonadales bacterium]
MLLLGGKIGHVGRVDPGAVRALGLECRVIDADGCLVTPGLVDPHEHLLGGSGESGFASQTPEIFLRELVSAGITSVVGCLGVDTTMKTLAGLLGRVKGLRAEGIGAWMWTGGYNVPPTTVLGTIRNDVMFLDEVIGAGEVAIADARATEPDPRELAKVVHDAYVGGILSGKAGVTHLHVGEGERRLACLRELLDRTRFTIEPSWLYATHVQRNERLLGEAVELAHRGIALDFDVAAHDLPRWLARYRELGGPLDRLTFSSDADGAAPGTLLSQFSEAVREARVPLEEALPHVTTNPAAILRLPGKGTVEPGRDADVLVLEPDTLRPVHVIAGGKRFVVDGEMAVEEEFLKESDRSVVLEGKRARRGA